MCLTPNSKRTFYLSITLLFLSLNLISQDVSEQRYRKDLSKAETLQDTIVALLTYKITTDLDSAKVIQLMDETLSHNLHELVAVEKASLSNDTLKLLKNLELLTRNNNLPLRKYSLAKLRMREINEGKSDQVNNEVLSGDLSDPKNLIFSYYLKSSQHEKLNQVDSMVLCMKKVTEGIDGKTYSALQLDVITYTLNKLYTRVTDETSIYIDKGLKISESLMEYDFRSVLYNVQTAYRKNKGDIEGAMKSALKFVEANEKSNNYERTVRGYLNLSSFHQEQGRFGEAYALILKARELAKSIEDNATIAMTYSSEANVKMNEKKYPEAIRILKKSKEIDHTNTRLKLMVGINLLESYYSISKLDSAYIEYKAVEAIDPENRNGLLNFAKTFVSKYLVDKKEYKKAQQYINDAMTDAIAYDDLSSKSIVIRAQSELDEAKGNYKNALDNYKKHAAIEQDFRNEDLASATTKIQLESDFKNEKEIIELTNEKEKLKITSERNQALLLGGLALLAALSALGFYLFLRRKNNQIEIQNQKLEELNNVKDTLFQIIGHDLKKPTINFRNVSKNISYLLEKQDYKRLQLLGEEVDQDAKSLYNLTDNLLNWALMQKDTISIKPENVNVHEIVNYNFDLFATLAKRKGINLENRIEKDVSSMVDRNSLDTIVRNLIDNALKYTQEGGLIALDSKITDGTVRLSITDNGVGMNKNVIDAISNDQSIKSEKGTEGEKGSGIGLQLVKQLLKKNNGYLNIESTEGSGSTISINLPLAS